MGMKSLEEISLTVQECRQYFVDRENDEQNNMEITETNITEMFEGSLQSFLQLLEIKDDDEGNTNNLNEAKEKVEFYIKLIEIGSEHTSLFASLMVVWKYLPKLLKQKIKVFDDNLFHRLLVVLLQYCEDGFRALSEVYSRSLAMLDDDTLMTTDRDPNEDAATLFLAESEQTLKILIFFIQRLSLLLSMGRLLIQKCDWIPALKYLFGFYGMLSVFPAIERNHSFQQSLKQSSFQSLMKILTLTDTKLISSPIESDLYDRLNLDLLIIYETTLAAALEDDGFKANCLLLGIEQFYQKNIQILTNQSSSTTISSLLVLDRDLDCGSNDETLSYQGKVWENWIRDILQNCLTCQALKNSLPIKGIKVIGDNHDMSISQWFNVLQNFLCSSLVSPPQQLFLYELMILWLTEHACGCHYKSSSNQNLTILVSSSSTFVENLIHSEILLARVLLISFLNLIEQNESLQAILSLVIIQIHKSTDSKAQTSFRCGLTFDDDWISHQITLTMVSLLSSSGNEQSHMSLLRVKIMLQWIGEYFVFLLSDQQNKHLMENENPLFLLPINTFEELLLHLPYQVLLSISSIAAIPDQVESLLQSLLHYFSQLQSINAEMITKRSQVNSVGNLMFIPSYPTLSIAFHMILGILTASRSTGRTHQSTSITLQSFIQNQSVATLILQQIIILFQQYQHYFEYHRARLVSLKSTHAEVDVFYPSLLIKFFRILKTEKKLFQLLQQHTLSNGVRMILLKAYTMLTNSAACLVDQYLFACRRNRSNERQPAPSVTILLLILSEMVSISNHYLRVFFELASLPDSQTQLLLSGLQSLMVLFKLIELPGPAPTPDGTDINYFIFQRILDPLNEIIQIAEGIIPSKQFHIILKVRDSVYPSWKEEVLQEMTVSYRHLKLHSHLLIVNQQINLHE